MLFKKNSSQCHLSILGNEVDVAVVAAAGLAVFGGVGVLLLKDQIQGLPNDPLTNNPLLEEAPLKAVPAEFPVEAAVDDSTMINDDTWDLSIPYDAAARLAYENSGMDSDYAIFKANFEADAVADVIAKKKKRDAVSA
jgi:hypothetical protein